MIEISFLKLLIVAIVALIVLGPKQLPDAARMLGRLLGYFRNTVKTAQNEFNSLALEAKKDFSSEKTSTEESQKTNE